MSSVSIILLPTLLSFFCIPRYSPLPLSSHSYGLSASKADTQLRLLLRTLYERFVMPVGATFELHEELYFSVVNCFHALVRSNCMIIKTLISFLKTTDTTELLPQPGIALLRTLEWVFVIKKPVDWRHRPIVSFGRPIRKMR